MGLERSHNEALRREVEDTDKTLLTPVADQRGTAQVSAILRDLTTKLPLMSANDNQKVPHLTGRLLQMQQAANATAKVVRTSRQPRLDIVRPPLLSGEATIVQPMLPLEQKPKLRAPRAKPKLKPELVVPRQEEISAVVSTADRVEASSQELAPERTAQLAVASLEKPKVQVDQLKNSEAIEAAAKAKARMMALVDWIATERQKKVNTLESAWMKLCQLFNRPVADIRTKAVKAFPDIAAGDIDLVLANYEKVAAEPKLQDALVAGSIDIGGLKVYKTNDVLGAGNVASVCAGFAVVNGVIRDVAIKEPHVITAQRIQTDDSKRLREFQRTAQIAYEVECSNAKQLLQSPISGCIKPLAVSNGSIESGTAMICYERIKNDKKSIDLTKLTPDLSSSQLLSIYGDAAYALHELHQRGFIHGDFKPGNIAVEQTGNLLRGTVVDIGSMYRPEEVIGYQDSVHDGHSVRMLKKTVLFKNKSEPFLIPTSPSYTNGYYAQYLREQHLPLQFSDVRAFGLSLARFLYKKGLINTANPTPDTKPFEGIQTVQHFTESGRTALQELYTLTVQLTLPDAHPDVANLKNVAFKLRQLIPLFAQEIDSTMGKKTLMVAA